MRSLRRNRRDDDRLRRNIDQTAKAGKRHRGGHDEIVADRPDEVGFQHGAIVGGARVVADGGGFARAASGGRVK